MKYYPIYLDLKDRNCLVVGGGSVGARKVNTLLECGASVTVVSPTVTEPLRVLSQNNSILFKQREYQSVDLTDMILVIGATDDRTLNYRIYEEATALNILCNIADQPDICHFILPAVVNRGDLIIAVSTSGNSPAFAKQLRKDLEAQFGPEYDVFLRLMGQIRKKLLKDHHEPEAHKPLFEKLISEGLLNFVKNEDEKNIDALLKSVLGKKYSYRRLMMAE